MIQTHDTENIIGSEQTDEKDTNISPVQNGDMNTQPPCPESKAEADSPEDSTEATDAQTENTVTSESPCDEVNEAVTDNSAVNENLAQGAECTLEGEIYTLLSAEPKLSEIAGGAINEKRYRELRALGLSVREAYLASSAPRGKDNRSHLITAVPQRATSPGTGMSSSEMELARSLFEGLPESEIKRLYSKVTR